MRRLTSKIYELTKEELADFLRKNTDIISCQCKGDYPDELKSWVEGELKKCAARGDAMRMDELRRGKITRPKRKLVETLLKKENLFQIEAVLHNRDFFLLEKGMAGDYTFVVKYPPKVELRARSSSPASVHPV